MDQLHRVLLISGSLRRASTNTAVLATARAVAPPSMTMAFYEGAAGLPHFNPDDDEPPRPPLVEEFRATIRSADAVLFSTPEYAGGLPGSFKNVLDWAVGDEQVGSLNGKAVAWINASPRGAADAHAALRKVLGYLGANIVEDACIEVPVGSSAIGSDGQIASPEVHQQLASALLRLQAALPSQEDSSEGEAFEPD